MEEDFSDEKRKKRFENLIFRKSLLNGQTPKIARDNIKLRENLRKLAKSFLKKGGNHEQKSSG